MFAFIPDIKLFLGGNGLQHKVRLNLPFVDEVFMGINLMGEFEIPIIFHLSKDWE